jgi:hypothetical protein
MGSLSLDVVHSKEVGIWALATTPRCDANLSHKIKINSMRATNDIRDPIDDTTFHLIRASG